MTGPSSSSSKTISSQLSTLSVELLGIYDMVRHVSDARFNNAATNPSVDSLLLQHGFRAAITWGFVSTCCLGPEGRRGIWIERTRSSTTRTIMAFSVDWTDVKAIPINVAFPVIGEGVDNSDDEYRTLEEENSDSDDSITCVPWMEARHIDGRSIYVMSSYDLRGKFTSMNLCGYSVSLSF
jgi:hypothetical protein